MLRSARLSSSEYSAESVPDAIVAVVLLLIAGYPADAVNVAGVAASLDLGESSSARVLNSAINLLATSRLSESMDQAATALTRRESYMVSNDPDLDRDDATELLWLRMTEGVGQLAGELVGREDATAANAEEIFRQIVSLSSQPYTANSNPFESTVVSNFAGPSFLASLLLRLPRNYLRVASFTSSHQRESIHNFGRLSQNHSQSRVQLSGTTMPRRLTLVI